MDPRVGYEARCREVLGSGEDSTKHDIVKASNGIFGIVLLACESSESGEGVLRACFGCCRY